MKEETILQQASDKIVTFRFLQRDDYKRGFPKVLEGLTKGCHYSESEFIQRFDSMFPSEAQIYKIIVLVDNKSDTIIGAGTMFTEKKFIRNAGVAGHIEDIVVMSSHRGQ